MEPPVLTRWRHAQPPTKETLEAVLQGEGLEAHWWSNGPGDTYPPHVHPYHKVLFCSEGTLTFILHPTDERLLLGPGDRLDLPAGWAHSARVGVNGTTCVEGWRE